MRRFAWSLVLSAALLGACGGQPAAEVPTSAATAPSSAPTTAAATAVPTLAPTAEPATSVPAPTLAPSVEASAEPTAQLILPPTTVPTAASQANAASQPTAKPAAAPQPAATPQPAAAQPRPAPAASAAPARLVIEDIGLDYHPVSVGLDKQRVPIVPEHDVGWYNLSAGPGEGENIVLWGHVLRFRNAPKIPAPFARVKELKPGASVVLYDSAGKAHNYVIKQQVWVRPDQVEYILPQGHEVVTMVSCIGDKVITNGEVVDESHRLITIAEPA